MSALESNAQLLSEDARGKIDAVPKGRGFTGQSNVCFMQSHEASRYVDYVLRQIDGYSSQARRAIPPEQNHPETVHDKQHYIEGAVRRVTVNAFERNPAARRICINHWGVRCSVCDMDFEEVYGKIGTGFIHIHHKVPIASLRQSYVLDPIHDLIPICPNCHAMLHSSDPPLSVEELKAKMKEHSASKSRQRMRPLGMRR